MNGAGCGWMSCTNSLSISGESPHRHHALLKWKKHPLFLKVFIVINSVYRADGDPGTNSQKKDPGLPLPGFLLFLAAKNAKPHGVGSRKGREDNYFLLLVTDLLSLKIDVPISGITV
jgi:hypothetical protein